MSFDVVFVWYDRVLSTVFRKQLGIFRIAFLKETNLPYLGHLTFKFNGLDIKFLAMIGSRKQSTYSTVWDNGDQFCKIAG